MSKIFATSLIILLFAASVQAAEFHVATNGNDTYPGTVAQPFRTIQRAADAAQAGDVITVHAGTYRERIDPPRGGESDARRIVYRAALGEKVTITGSEVIKGWEKIANDTWKVTLPNSYFGDFNPYADVIHGDWYRAGRALHTGCVYLNGNWMMEATSFEQASQPFAAGQTPLWFAVAGGDAGEGGYLMNVAWFQIGGGPKIPAASAAARRGTQNAACAEGGSCVGYIADLDWLRFDGVDFGAGARSATFRVAAGFGGGEIELHLDGPNGKQIGLCKVPSTQDWQKWISVSAEIQQPVTGKRNLCLLFRPPGADNHNTEIHAQFPGIDPNEAQVEINRRQVVFYPSKTGINYITVRGFTLEDAAPNWAPPTAEQKAIIGPHWSKGWIIEDNTVRNSPCCGISLGKYGDEWDNRAESAEGYVATIHRALKNGWNKESVGSHIIRNNRIYNCGQAGIVGSMGCAFSTVEGNEIHDIYMRQVFGGAEMAGIKFHGAVDVVIRSNHIYRTGQNAIWMDWMAQGAQIVGNLIHDTGAMVINLEVDHGPLLIANNLLLSSSPMQICGSNGVAFIHNLSLWSMWPNGLTDTRLTPFLKPHSTEIAGLHDTSHGDDRIYNNVFAANTDMRIFDNALLPSWLDGNVYLTNAMPPKAEKDPIVKPKFDPGIKVVEKSDGWYLDITLDKAWASERTRQLVTTELLGKARIPDQPYTNRDGSPISIDTDYFGQKRNEANPFPGPFQVSLTGKQSLKVWPKALTGLTAP